MDLSGDGRLLLTCEDLTKICIYDLASRELIWDY